MRFSSSVTAERSSALPTRLVDAQVKARVSGIVRTAETHIAYVQFGQNDDHTTSIMNCGPGFSHAYMYLAEVFTREFAHDRTVTFYDQRGVGNSKLMVASAPQGMPSQGADLEALRVKLRYYKIDLIGHSWGGKIAMA
jgi:pimeloyl-ACP methyl ester carboxylesterase